MNAFLGNEAIANRAVTRGELRSRYTRVLPNVYVHKGVELTLEDRAQAAWVWCGQSGVIAGRTAAGLYLDPWTATTDPIELIALKSRHPPGLIVRNERIAVDEITVTQRLPVTSPARTAFDLARHHDRAIAIELMDRLAGQARISKDDILRLAERYPRTRGINAAKDAIRDIDPGARTPEETRVRLILSDDGLRPTHTQIRVTDGFAETVIAMGWPAQKVGVNCDYLSAQRFPYSAVDTAGLLQDLGWLVIDALPDHTARYIYLRTRDALRSRTRRPPGALR